VTGAAAPRQPTRPYVDRPLRDLVAARRLADDVATELDLPAPTLVRRGMNAVFRSGRVAIRVGLPTARPHVSIELARWLTAMDVIVPRPASDQVFGAPAGEAHSADANAEDAGGERPAATVWEWIEPIAEPVDWRAVGAMLAALHAADVDLAPPGLPLPVPWRFPWWDFAGLFEALDERALRTVHDDQAYAAMRAVVDQHAGWDTPTDPLVLCHGDVHPGNVIMSAHGAVLIDWDLMCVAPRGWDHGPMMRWATHWGGVPEDYVALAAGYGRSMVGDPFAEAVADLRLVAATLMRVRAAEHDPAARVEAERRLASWCGVDTGPWHAQ
jgi:hypothetical protein